jgi:nucleotide-binding universal stress UspA family protein
MRELLLRDLRAWVGELPGSGDTSLSVNPCFDRVAHRLAALAEQDKVDLLVLGMRSRPFAKRLWQGSVSREALASAACNVACVPMGDEGEAQPGIPTFRHVLIPTDFSTLANRAIPVGYGLLPMGGLVHLIHVSTHEEGPSEADRTRRLRALIPAGAAAKGVATEIELVNAQSACTGIWQAAERLGVDVLCMATHGRTGVARALMGSEAAQVIQHARRPVVLVPPDPDAAG